ncbi:unnamed protein product, partial [Amoebophrya sp. A120]
ERHIQVPSEFEEDEGVEENATKPDPDDLVAESSDLGIGGTTGTGTGDPTSSSTATATISTDEDEAEQEEQLEQSVTKNAHAKARLKKHQLALQEKAAEEAATQKA